MKIAHLLLVAALSASITSNAQWPSSISFNTANNNLGGVVGVGTADNTWRCSPLFGGPFNLIPQQVAPVTGWHDGNSTPFFPCDAEWISFPHTCDPNGDIRQDHCNCQPYKACTDEYYEFRFNLNSVAPYVLPLTMMADNCIVEVWLNNVSVYTAPAAQLAAGSPFYGGYLYTGFAAGSEVNLNIPGPFLPGANSLKVHVRSGINQANTGWTGFVCFNTPCYREDGGAGDPRDLEDPKDRVRIQKSLIEQQQNQINELEETLRQTKSGSSVSLSDKNAVVLNQNVPNPFAESTVISYNVPQGFTTARLTFRTQDGTLIKSIDITRSGAGSVTVYADDLSKGTYTYSLVVDDRVHDSKKMVKQ